MRWKIKFLVLFLTALPSQAQQSPPPDMPSLAFKLLVRSTQPTFAPGSPLKLEVACVGIPKLASPEWQNRWDEACSNVKLEVEDARIGGYWGGVGLIAWLQNQLHICLPAPGESDREPFHLDYTEPHWRPVTVGTEKLLKLRGMVQINAQVDLMVGQTSLATERAQAVTAIVPHGGDAAEADLDGNIQIDAAAVQSGDLTRVRQLSDELLENPTLGALKTAVKLFDNTHATDDLWTVIENAPNQSQAIELMESRLKETNFIPDYDLLAKLTGMKSRLGNPLEFEAEDGQPYREYHPDLEKAALDYFRSLLDQMAASSGDPRSARVTAIREIVDSLVESDQCDLGTYGLSTGEATALKAKLPR